MTIAAKDGVTPLMVAARLNNAAFVQSLVALSDVKAADKDGYTALHYAIDAGSLPITKMLVTSGANPLAATKNGDTAIERAVMRPDEAILAYLLDDVKVDGKNLVPTKRATDWCVIHNKVLPLATLVSHGAEVTDRHLAAAVLIDMKDDVLDMVKYLVEIGCDVNAPEVHKAVNRRLGTQDANVIFNGEIPAKVTDSLSSMNSEVNGKITTNAVSVTNRPASLGVVADPVVKFLLDNGYRSVDGEPRFIR